MLSRVAVKTFFNIWMPFLSLHSFENISTDKKLKDEIHERLIVARDKSEVAYWKFAVAFHL